jgi:hypothetical protein
MNAVKPGIDLSSERDVRQHDSVLDAVTDSPNRKNPTIGFVLQPQPRSPEIGFVPHTTHNAAQVPPSVPPVRTDPPRYTVISDINSPIRPWLK